jgi:hypothetical protein
MGKRTKPASWAAAGLVAQSFAKKLWVVEEFGCTVALVARIPMAASTGIVKLLCARFALVSQPTAFQEDKPTAITATVVKRTTTVVV